jgi:sec-independent protein translocase protein TatC
MTLAQHLRELRSRLFRGASAITVGAAIAWFQYDSIFDQIRRPFDEVAGSNTVLALPGITSGFSLQLKVALAAGVVLSSPIWLYQLWRFIAPGLRHHEKKWALVFTAIGVPLFLSGLLLAYVVMPRTLEVLFDFTPQGVSNFTNVETYIGFFLQIEIFFGLAFLLPLVLVMLNFAGLLTGKRIKDSWRWIIFLSFVFGAIATPSGDPIGMTIIAIPMICLSLFAMAIALVNDRRRLRKQKSSGTNQWSDDEASPLEV